MAFADPINSGAEVVAEIRKSGVGLAGDTPQARLICMSTNAVGALDLGLTLFPGVIHTLRSEGQLRMLMRALVSVAWAQVHLGDLRGAYASVAESGRIADELHEPGWRALGRVAHGLVHALRGEAAAAERTFVKADEFIVSSGVRSQIANLRTSRGIAAFSAGHIDDAYDYLKSATDPNDPQCALVEPYFALAYFADMGVLTGNVSEAAAVVAKWEAKARHTTAAPIRWNLDYARVRLLDGSEFEDGVRVLLAGEIGRQPFFRARLQLAFGVWLRRERRSAEARAHLREARDTLDALGVRPWADRARQELRAAGEVSPVRVVSGIEHLTPQELQIARMAADGLSNKEIGQQLFVSHRTVGSHLYRIFPKLEITNRAQLRDALERQQHLQPSN